MGPIPEGFYTLPDLNEGTITLCDVARANDMLAVRAENRRRAESKP
jgi:hypothetical protein